MVWFFTFFLVSGFCSILYEIVWLRLAMAQFGVTTALASIVISVFMAGLGLGSWGSGRLIRNYENRVRVPALRIYALAELLIGISALLVPYQLLYGRKLLEWTGASSSWAYYLGSGIWIALTLVPWCACMGATIPVAMLAIRRWDPERSQRSFSYLYLSNVLGAVIGATFPLLLIELYGFRDTLKIGAAFNGLLALSAMSLSLGRTESEPTGPVKAAPAMKEIASRASSQGNKPLVLLFLTGLTSIGMEVVWIRQFTPYLGTVVYAFASILATYLVSTFIGLQIYRLWSGRNRREGNLIWVLLGLFALLPLLAANPGIHISRLLRLIVGIAPFSGVLGFLTPLLVDRWSGGDPGKAGKAYAVNVLGCILGPLLSGFLLLPLISERWVLFVLLAALAPDGGSPGWAFRRDVSTGRQVFPTPWCCRLWRSSSPRRVTKINSDTVKFCATTPRPSSPWERAGTSACGSMEWELPDSLPSPSSWRTCRWPFSIILRRTPWWCVLVWAPLTVP